MTEADYQAFLLRSEAESELADKLYVEKLKRLNERKKANSKKLREMGIDSGDTIRIEDYEFEYYDEDYDF